MECAENWPGHHGTEPKSPDGWWNFPAPTRNRPKLENGRKTASVHNTTVALTIALSVLGSLMSHFHRGVLRADVPARSPLRLRRHSVTQPHLDRVPERRSQSATTCQIMEQTQ